MNKDFYPHRSALYMPGSNERALEKAKTLSADLFIFDFEDAVSPENKEMARELVSRVLTKQKGEYGQKKIITRVNSIDTIWGQLDIECCSFDDLVKLSDAITLHVPLNQDTQNLFSKKEFEKMKKGSFIINTSRGGIIKESELLKYLKNGHLGGAMIDVFESEPVKDSKSFSDIPNLILTPHIAGLTSESNVRVSQTITEQILSFLDNGGGQI